MVSPATRVTPRVLAASAELQARQALAALAPAEPVLQAALPTNR